MLDNKTIMANDSYALPPSPPNIWSKSASPCCANQYPFVPATMQVFPLITKSWPEVVTKPVKDRRGTLPGDDGAEEEEHEIAEVGQLVEEEEDLDHGEECVGIHSIHHISH